MKLKDSVKFCGVCNNLSDTELCEICSNESRDKGLLCVVEKPGDVISIEKMGQFRGVYHVLLGALSPLDGVGPGDLKINELVKANMNNQFSLHSYMHHKFYLLYVSKCFLDMLVR